MTEHEATPHLSPKDVIRIRKLIAFRLASNRLTDLQALKVTLGHYSFDSTLHYLRSAHDATIALQADGSDSHWTFSNMRQRSTGVASALTRLWDHLDRSGAFQARLTALDEQLHGSTRSE